TRTPLASVGQKSACPVRRGLLGCDPAVISPTQLCSPSAVIICGHLLRPKPLRAELTVSDKPHVVLSDEAKQRSEPRPVIVRLDFPAMTPEVVDAAALLGFLE